MTLTTIFIIEKLLFKSIIGIKEIFWIFVCCYVFILIFKFILIYFLHVLFVLKIEGIFGKKNIIQKC